MTSGPQGQSRTLSLLVRLAIAVALTVWVVSKSHPAEIGRALAGTSWSWLAGACLLLIPDRILMAYRWIALLAPVREGRPPFSTILRVFLVSTFVGTFLPGSVGGDAARAWSLAREGVSMSQSVASVLLDRVLGVVSIVISAAIGFALVPWLVSQPLVIWPFLVAIAGCVVALTIVFSGRVDNWLRTMLGRRANSRIGTVLSSLLDALKAYRAAHGMLFVVLLASIAVQLIRVFQGWMLGRSLGIDAPFVTYCAFIPIIVLAMQVPISISGIGVSQFLFPFCFRRAGVDDPSAVALSVLFVALGIVGSLPGAVPYVIGKKAVGHGP